MKYIYRNKETDSHMYLHSQSGHPTTTKKAIAHGLGIRARRICSQENDYMTETDKIKENLFRRGYSRRDTHKSLTKVDGINRGTLLNYNTKKSTTNERVPLCLTYNRGLPNIQRILHDRLPILHRSTHMKSVFPKAPITAFKRDTNLEDMLVHKKHNVQMPTGQHKKCEKKCAVCPFIRQELETKTGSVTFSFNNHIGCKSQNLVYGIY